MSVRGLKEANKQANQQPLLRQSAWMAAKRKAKRNRKGFALAEVAFGGIIMTALTIFCVDIGCLMLTYSNTDRAARDAARAAAQGTSKEEAESLAQAIVRGHEVASFLISPPQIKSVVYNDFGGNPPEGTSPIVSVTTIANAQIPAPVTLLGGSIGEGKFMVQKTYTFPIVKIKL